MYGVAPRAVLHESLCTYIDGGAADAVGLDEKRKCYTFTRPDGHTMLYGGLVSKLKQLYYPRYKNSKRQKKTHKKGSNAKLGKRIDNETMMITASKQYENKGKIKPFHKMTVRLVKELIEEKDTSYNARSSPS